MTTADTHKHRNIIDDILDLGLLLGGLLYFLFGEKLGLSFTDKEFAAIASTGATARILIRKILMNLWGAQIQQLEAASSRSEEPTEHSKEPPKREDAEKDESDESDEEEKPTPIVPPPPKLSGS